ncbi:MAG: hypothetical protein PWR03_1656 [Tenuifilum sp.]|nr:hypothetical protein [Tenuifilum sp.]
MNFIKRYIFLFSFPFLCITVNAQDVQFTQFYANPLYLSPSFTGGVVGYRVVANYRNQWTFVPGTYNTFSLSWDHNSPAFRSGFGIIAMRD